VKRLKDLKHLFRHLFDVFHCQVQYDGDLDIEIDEEDLKMDGPLLDKLRD
jgi:hypothetical protein